MFTDLFAGLVLSGGGTTGITFDWSNIITSTTFQPLVDGIATLVPIAVGVAIPLMVINKGWNWIRGVVYSA